MAGEIVTATPGVKEIPIPDTGDAFEEAFAQISAAAGSDRDSSIPGSEDAAKMAEAAKAKADADAAAKVAEDVAKVAVAPTVVEEPVVAPVEPPSVVAAPAVDDEFLKRFVGAIKKEIVTEPVRVVEPVEPVKPPFTDDEMKVLASYEEEFPQIATAESLRRREEYKQVVGYVFSEVTRAIAPIQSMLATLSERTHLGDLRASVPDYDVTRDKVIEWVGKQPDYLKAAYARVVQQGTVDEVADMITRYKAENGMTAATDPAKAAAAAAVSAAATAAEAAKVKAAKALAPVATKRSGVVAPVESGDFDAAFKAFGDLQM